MRNNVHKCHTIAEVAAERLAEERPGEESGKKSATQLRILMFAETTCF